MKPLGLQRPHLERTTRRHFLQECGAGLGALWLAQTAGASGIDSIAVTAAARPHSLGRAKRVIYLHMAGSPSTLDLFDYKPDLAKLDGQDCP